MRLSIAKATALEILCEPLSLLLLTASLAIAVFAPHFHYHQFGDATRMARDAGVTAMMLGGIMFSVFAASGTFRREIESGTAMMALSRPISRTTFFLCKALGVFGAYLVFSIVVIAVSYVIVNGAKIGGEISESTGDIARLWGPSYALGVAVIITPYIIGAILNRFARLRFVFTAFVISFLLAVVIPIYRFDGLLFATILSSLVPLIMSGAVFIAFASAVSVRFKLNRALSLTAILFFVYMPALGAYSFLDALTALPALVAFLIIGVKLLNARDFS